jgi:hypothetical protein
MMTSLTPSPTRSGIACDAIDNRTPIPIGASAGTLNTYHTILEKNHDQLSKEHNELDRRRQAADQSSERRRGNSHMEACLETVKAGFDHEFLVFRKTMQGK